MLPGLAALDSTVLATDKHVPQRCWNRTGSDDEAPPVCLYISKLVPSCFPPHNAHLFHPAALSGFWNSLEHLATSSCWHTSSHQGLMCGGICLLPGRYFLFSGWDLLLDVTYFISGSEGTAVAGVYFLPVSRGGATTFIIGFWDSALDICILTLAYFNSTIKLVIRSEKAPS